MNILSLRVIAVILAACTASSAVVPASAALTDDQVRIMYDALLYASRGSKLTYVQTTTAARCMTKAMREFNRPSYEWALSYYKGDLKQEQIDRDPLNMLDLLTDIGGSCQRIAIGGGMMLIRLSRPSASDRQAVVAVKGRSFPHEVGAARPTELLTAHIDLSASEYPLKALAVVQMALCSNHTCPFSILVFQDGKWNEVASFESWSAPYVVHKEAAAIGDIVYFDHITNDCMACSPPLPVRITWIESKQHYGEARKVPASDAKRFDLHAIKGD